VRVLRILSSLCKNFIFLLFTFCTQKSKPMPRMNNIKRGLSAAEYHADKSTISKHGLDLINQAPALYRWRLENPETIRTPALRWGNLVHLAVLEPHRMPAETVTLDADRRTKAGKEAHAEAAATGKEVISSEEESELGAIRAAVFAHPTGSKMLTGDLEIESSVYWTDSATGVACRARPDIIRRDGFVVDLKTCASASPRAFQRASWEYRYQAQAAFYLDGLRANEVDANKFAFVCVETKAPYLVAVYVADPELVAHGRKSYRRDLEMYHACRESEQWPGYSTAAQILSAPDWVREEVR
jgi:exodeoxyribonuclease VIII